jgi:uncharacterized protein YpbB
MKLQENYVNYVRNSVNVLVRDTGYPVLAKSLTEAGIATRKQLKVLVKKGHIMEMKVRVGRTIYNAYFTESEPPRKLVNRQVERWKG